MKTKILLFTTFILLNFFCSSQIDSAFTYGFNGLNINYSLVTIDSVKSKTLFEKSINWIKETYKNPDEVIKTTIDSNKIRFEGFQRAGLNLGVGLGGFDVKYTIELSFKDGKYRFKPISYRYLFPPNQYNNGGWSDFDLYDGSIYYKKNKRIRNMFKSVPNSISSIFNDLNNSLYNYLLKNNSKIKNEDNKW